MSFTVISDSLLHKINVHNYHEFLQTNIYARMSSAVKAITPKAWCHSCSCTGGAVVGLVITVPVVVALAIPVSVVVASLYAYVRVRRVEPRNFLRRRVH